MKEMRDWDNIARNKIECNLIYWKQQVSHDFEMRHQVIDNLGIQTCQASIREYKVWIQINKCYGIK